MLITHLRHLILATAAVALVASWTAPRAAAEDETQPAKRLTYRDDFSDPQKVENDSEVMQNVKPFPGFGLSSANGQPGYVLYDLSTLFPGLKADAEFTLIYDGGANGPDEQRGATWSASKDGKEWTDISVNKFNTPVKFKGQYLRASVRWIQAGGPDYGFLKSFTLKTDATK